MTTKSVSPDTKPPRGYGLTDVGMLAIVLGTLILVFLVGIEIITGRTTSITEGGITTIKAGFTSADVVAILAPVLGVIGTVAAGIFGYSRGSQGTSEAHQRASQASSETAIARQEALDTSSAASTLICS